MTIKLTPRKKLFVDTASEMFGSGAVITKQMIQRNRCKSRYSVSYLVSSLVQ